MKNEVDNVITLIQPKSEEEGLLNVVITDKKVSSKNAVSISVQQFQK